MRSGPCIQLASGRFFYFDDPRPEDIDIRDIAAHLSRLCRWTGACKSFYSVAQHSVHVSNLVPPEFALVGLLHDATEAYINDVSRPLKRKNPAYKAYEHEVLWPVIAKAFGIPTEIPPEVHAADNIALVTERRDLMPAPIYGDDENQDQWQWTTHITPCTQKLWGWPPLSACLMFKDRWKQITGETI